MAIAMSVIVRMAVPGRMPVTWFIVRVPHACAIGEHMFVRAMFTFDTGVGAVSATTNHTHDSTSIDLMLSSSPVRKRSCSHPHSGHAGCVVPPSCAAHLVHCQPGDT
jgi:hypothetical protein